MPAKDRYHETVKNALIKDGWQITADPYPIKYEEVKLAADLSSQRTLSANRGTEYVVVEIKSFLAPSAMREFETALGQYLIYRTFLEVTHPDYRVYLAIGSTIYRTFFQRVAIQLILKKYQVSLLVVNLEQEEIEQWLT
ncbi:MAG: XisH protein [Cyanothece sp. SIO2G6]|nr:XisH protein [Cyanothece sp. SIO2G6]